MQNPECDTGGARSKGKPMPFHKRGPSVLSGLLTVKCGMTDWQTDTTMMRNIGSGLSRVEREKCRKLFRIEQKPTRGEIMARVIRSRLVQASNPEPGTSPVKKIKQAMIEKHVNPIAAINYKAQCAAVAGSQLVVRGRNECWRKHNPTRRDCVKSLRTWKTARPRPPSSPDIS